MIDPYKMVLVNFTLSFLLTVGFLLYRRRFSKKKINFFFLLVFISLLPLISVFRKGVYESGDFNLHIYRTIPFFQALADRQFLPSWADMLNGGYGYPLYIFLNPLPYYLLSMFHLLGFSFIWSMKLFLISAYLLSGIGMYLFVKAAFKNEFAAFVAAIVYQFAPYHLVDIHFRVAVGETLFFAMLPLFFYCLLQLIRTQTNTSTILTGMAFASLFMAHQAMALFSIVLIIPFTLLTLSEEKRMTLKQFFRPLLSAVLGGLLVLYILLPQALYGKYTLVSLLNTGQVSFVPLQELFFSPWRYGFLFQGPTGQLSFLIGYTQILSIFTAIVLLSIKRMPRKLFVKSIFWLALCLLLIFFTTSASSFLWSITPYVKTARMASRLLLLLAFSISVLSGILTVKFQKQKVLLFFFVVLTVGYTMLNWGNRRTIPEISDTALNDGLAVSSAAGEGLVYIASPKWVNSNRLWHKEKPDVPLQILSGKAEHTALSRSTISHTYILYVTSDAEIRENTLFFPGWKVFDNNREIPIHYEDKKQEGIISFSVPKGLHYIELRYHDLADITDAKRISVTVLLICLLYLVVSLFKKQKKLTK